MPATQTKTLDRQQILNKREAAARDPAEWQKWDEELRAHERRAQRPADLAKLEAKEAHQAQEAQKQAECQKLAAEMKNGCACQSNAAAIDDLINQFGPVFSSLISENARLHGETSRVCQETARNGEVWLGDAEQNIVAAVLQQLRNSGFPVPMLAEDRNARTVADTVALAMSRYCGELKMHANKKGYSI